MTSNGQSTHSALQVARARGCVADWPFAPGRPRDVAFPSRGTIRRIPALGRSGKCRATQTPATTGVPRDARRLVGRPPG
jgi:hypothetical protein